MVTTLTPNNDGARMSIEERQPNWHTMSTEERTSWFISEMLSALTGEQSYEAAMNEMLNMLSTVIHTDRMSVFECGGAQTTVTFEKCAEGIPSLLGVTFDLPRWAISKWFGLVKDKPIAQVPDVSIIEGISKPLYDWCRLNGISSLAAVPFFNEGEVVGFLGAYNSQTDETIDLNRLFVAVSSFIGARIENRRLIKSLQWAGEHDALTELYDRRGSEAAIKRHHSEHPDDPCALIIIDIDDFKRINDVYGHAVGDKALKEVAQAMKRVFPKDAILCRNGGDEFLVALFGDDSKHVKTFVKEFSQAGLEFEVGGERRKMTSSIGYALYPEHASSLMVLYAKADAALYAVKLTGKASYGEYTPNSEAHYRSQLGFSARDIVENVPYSMVVHKAGDVGSLLFASSKFVRLLGCEDMYELMRAAGGSFAGIVHADDRDRVHDELRALETEGANADEGRNIDFRALVKGGDSKNVHAITRLVDIRDVGQVFYTLVSSA